MHLLGHKPGHSLRVVFVMDAGTGLNIHQSQSESISAALQVLEACKIIVKLKPGTLLEFGLNKVAASHWSHVDHVHDQLLHLMQQTGSGVFLEVGGRGAQSKVVREQIGGNWRYLALDIKPGSNVDLVGDIHTMSEILGQDSVDIVYSKSVFEHLYMPWQAALEIGRVLKPGGLCYVHTPYFWPFHEIPWDFFRFSKYSWSALFNELWTPPAPEPRNAR